MSRNIQKIRRSIKQRKKERDLQLPTDNEGTPFIPLTPTDEEKYGMDTNIYPFATEMKMNKLTIPYGFLLKLVGAAILFIGSLYLINSEAPSLDNQKNWLMSSLTEEFPFATAHEWYVANLGVPLSLTPQSVKTITKDKEAHALPVVGQVVEDFSMNGTGILIFADNRSAVTAMEQGIVVFAGNNLETKKTVTIQHADKSLTTYGFLDSIDVHPYQLVQAHQTIGSYHSTDANEAFYFSIEKENQFIDPTKVIPVDDLP